MPKSSLAWLTPNVSRKQKLHPGPWWLGFLVLWHGLTFLGTVQITSRVFFGEPGPWFNQLDMDGDKTSVFHDVDGSVSEYPGSYLTKEDNWLVRHPDCIDVPDWRGAICSGRYAQVRSQVFTCSLTHALSEPLLYPGSVLGHKRIEKFFLFFILFLPYLIEFSQDQIQG